MTEQKQNIEIAKALGWIEIKDPLKALEAKQFRFGAGEVWTRVGEDIPCYTEDLNATHQVWINLIQKDEKLRSLWRYHLQVICARDEDKLGFRSCSNATAAQRVEVTLLTLNLWKD